MQCLRFVLHRRFTLLTALIPLLIGSMFFGVLRVQASGTTRYVNPDGVCSQQLPCYTTILNAINNSSSGDTIILQANITEGDLVENTSLANLTIEGYSPTNLVTLTGGMNWPVVNNWTFQDMKITQDLAVQSAPTGVTINAITFTKSGGATIGIGSTTANIGGTISITNNSLPGGNSLIAIMGGDGLPINGTINISNNATVNAIDVLAYVKSGGSGNFNANLTVNQNSVISAVDTGVTYRSNNTGVGNITGNITMTNNTTTGAASYLGVDISGLTGGSGLQNVTGNISGNMTFTGNTTYQIAAVTTDSPGPSNMSGDINASNNNCERLEFGYNGALSSNSISITNNYVVYKGSAAGTFIAVDGYNIAANTVINIANNTGNTGIIVQAKTGSNAGQTTISTNQATHAIYQFHTTNSGALTISGNTITGNNPQTNAPDGFITIQSDTASLAGGMVSYNHATNLQVTMGSNLAGALTVIGNQFDTLASIFSTASAGPGTLTMTGNRMSNRLYISNTKGEVHFNAIIGHLDTGGATVNAQDNWWGCNAGAAPSSPCHSYINGGILEPHLVLQIGATCTSTRNLGVVFNLTSDNNGTQTVGNTTPAVATIGTSIGTVGPSPVAMRNAAGGSYITLPVNGGTATASVTVDSQALTQSPTCNSANAIDNTIGVYRNGTFLLRNSNSTGNADLYVTFNPATTPYPVVGDWGGTGVDTVGIYDQSNGLFTLCSVNGTASCADSANLTQLVLGNPNDQPIAGRWSLSITHDGVGVFRPSNGLIYLKNALSTGYADYTMVLGIPGDVGVAGDWNGDGLDSPGVFRPSLATFYLSDQDTNASVYGDYNVTLGLTGDAPIVGDWIAQGHAGVGVFRPTNGLTYLKNALTTGYADNTFTYGIAGDIPVAGHWGAGGPVPNPGVTQVLVPGAVPSVPSTPAPSSGLGD